VAKFLIIKLQIPNIKWFDRLTTLSQVEGQITMTKILNSKPVNDLTNQNDLYAQFQCFGHWKLKFEIYL